MSSSTISCPRRLFPVWWKPCSWPSQSAAARPMAPRAARSSVIRPIRGPKSTRMRAATLGPSPPMLPCSAGAFPCATLLRRTRPITHPPLFPIILITIILITSIAPDQRLRLLPRTEPKPHASSLRRQQPEILSWPLSSRLITTPVLLPTRSSSIFNPYVRVARLRSPSFLVATIRSFSCRTFHIYIPSRGDSQPFTPTFPVCDDYHYPRSLPSAPRLYP
ncbi:hypothetical protein FB45DRAFT_176747 [Roridomyces roridus]|uniref:Uncharacterized protein n=1 Tax=Roridomyces roridus TaxID=1738132 RepID=A0AAD7CFJ7_9AGAR|nr:hypothetical protein FB45DRAFT_176747 [Roridomyces roridus]